MSRQKLSLAKLGCFDMLSMSKFGSIRNYQELLIVNFFKCNHETLYLIDFSKIIL